MAFYSYVPLCSRMCSSSSNNCIAAAFANATMTQMYSSNKNLELEGKGGAEWLLVASRAEIKIIISSLF